MALLPHAPAVTLRCAHATRRKKQACSLPADATALPMNVWSLARSQPPGHDLRLGDGIHKTTFRVNVRWVTPLGEETASTS